MKVKNFFKKVIYITGILCIIFATILFEVALNYESKIKNMNSQIDFLNSQIEFLQEVKIEKNSQTSPYHAGACFVYSLHAYSSNPSWYDEYKSLGSAFFKTRSSENIPTSNMIFAENMKVMYFYTAISSDFASYDNKDIYLGKILDQVKGALNRPWCAGLYVHELLTYLSSINNWNWGIAVNITDWQYLDSCIYEAWLMGKKVMWSEPSYAWQTVYESRVADRWLNQTHWKEALILTFATNFPNQIWHSCEYAYALSERFHYLLGESIQDWYFIDQKIAVNQTLTEWLGRMGWIIGVKYFEVEGANMDPAKEFMIGVKNLAMKYGLDKTPPTLTLSYGDIGQTKNVSSQTMFTLTASDANGVIAVMYKIGNEEWQTYSEPFTLEELIDGIYVIECVAVDSYGNVVEHKETITLTGNP